MPKLTHFVLHGADMTGETIHYMLENLPPSLVSLDIANNYIHETDVQRLLQRCLNLRFLDISSTMVTNNVLPCVAGGWKHSLVNLALPREIAIKLQMYTTRQEAEKRAALDEFVNWIEGMEKLTHLRIGNWKHDVSVEAQQTPQGNVSRAYIFKQKMVGALRELFPHLSILLNPHKGGDGGIFFQQHGYLEPNPNYPHESDPNYIFNTLGRPGKQDKKTNRNGKKRCHNPRARQENGEEDNSIPTGNTKPVADSLLFGRILQLF